jgi:ligand-binding sensor domain-containing protein/signal transduction histidine kinase
MHVRRQLKLAYALALLTAATRPGLALDPQSPGSRYRRTTLTTEDGLGANVINDILQTRDGFLWIGTYQGLTRFDGQHFTSVRGVKLNVNVHSMAEGPDGDLWLGTQAGVFRVSPRLLEQPGDPRVTVYHLGPRGDDAVSRVLVGQDGALWAGTRRGLYRWNGGSGFSAVVGGFAVNRFEEAPDGHILIPNSKGYVEWDGAGAVDHPEVVQQLGIGPDQVFHVFRDRQGAMWFSTGQGLFRQFGGSAINIGGRGRAVYQAYLDTNGNCWISTNGGVFRVRGNALEAVAVDVQSRVLFGDRDGGLWIGSNGDGLIHIQDRTVHMFTTADGLRSHVVMAALTTRSGKLWVATNCGGIAWFDGERFHPLPDKDHRADCAYTLMEDDNGDLLVGTFGHGIFRLHDGVLTPFLNVPDLPDDTVQGILSTHDGSLWIATKRGLARLRDGQLRTYTTADGLSDVNVIGLFKDGAGTFWVATATGVHQLVGDRFSQVISRPSPIVLGEDRGDFYIRFRDGISRFAGGKAPVALPHLGNPGMPSAMIVASNGLWLAEREGIVRTKRWEPDRGMPADYAIYTRADGMLAAECTDAGMGPHLTITRDGRLWVTTEQGLAMIDLPRLPPDAGKSVLYLRDTVVGRKSQRPGDRLVLPPGTSHAELAFDPIELSAPHRIRLQYKLDGVDDGWLDAPPSHVATYSGMTPGSHIFHVRATNRDGVWDLVGMTYQVTQEPFVYQTAWFQALGVAAFLGMLCGLYWYRIRRLAHEFNVRLEERVTERTRIARELHDTLLQSFQGSLYEVQAAQNLIPRRPDAAMQTLDNAIRSAEAAIAEGRDAILDLRSGSGAPSDLAHLLAAAGQELSGTVASNGGTPAFCVTVEGSPRDLEAILQDELYRIGREILRNAFRHARAKKIEVEIRHDAEEFRIRFRDDGIGIEPKVLDEGARPGHWGLPGVRERARLVGAQLDFWSDLGAGTEVQLTIPAAVAYGKSRGSRAFRFFRSHAD